jgi:Tfp pilus assembly protein PilV
VSKRLCNPLNHPRLHQRGTSLVEVIVSTLILSIVAISLVEFFAMGRVWFDQEERKRVATLLAQEAEERAVQCDYAVLQDWSEIRTVAATQYSTSVTVTPDAPDPNMKTIRVAVTWHATRTAERSVSLATFVYNQ